MDVTLGHWVSFNVLLFSLLALDLWYFYRHPGPIRFGKAIALSCAWISVAILFNAWIYVRFGVTPAIAFLTGYLVEESLSVDNLFIFLMIIRHFHVPESAQHALLFYGVLGAIAMRALLIVLGIALVHYFSWAFLLFGLFLIFMGVRLLSTSYAPTPLSEQTAYRLLQRWIPMTSEYYGNAFSIKVGGKWRATPLLAALILIESADLLFALDSVPAILGITTEPFIVYTSNICAVLGLRSLFFTLQTSMHTFYMLHYALAVILILIGLKMIAGLFIHIPIILMLGTVASLLAAGIILSLLFPRPPTSSSPELPFS